MAAFGLAAALWRVSVVGSVRPQHFAVAGLCSRGWVRRVTILLRRLDTTHRATFGRWATSGGRCAAMRSYEKDRDPTCASLHLTWASRAWFQGID